jgi:mono/diheme cytochrome c family protein
VVLYAQCDSEGAGALDAVIALNDQPEISALDIAPSKFISSCESATLVATASDDNGDALSYSWTVVDGPDGALLNATAGTATFSGPAGEYSLEVSVDDGHGGVNALQFPLHVAAAVCEVPAPVQAIFASRCAPCHTTGSSGSLHLDPASASYSALVGVVASAAACSAQQRVVPGDAAASYLVAKLRGSAGICGARMPRNAPALPEEEIVTIESWINSLPH